MTEFERMTKRKKVTCDVCGGDMLPMYGGGWENDRIICVDEATCGTEIVFPTSTVYESEEKKKQMTFGDVPVGGVFLANGYRRYKCNDHMSVICSGFKYPTPSNEPIDCILGYFDDNNDWIPCWSDRGK